MGQYPHTIDVMGYTETRDPMTGEITKGWSKSFDTEALVAAMSGNEFLEAQKLTNAMDYNVYTEYDERIQPNMRVQWNGITLNILNALPALHDINGDPEQLILKCSSNLS